MIEVPRANRKKLVARAASPDVVQEDR